MSGNPDQPAEAAGCASITPGMNYAEAVRMMPRPPDSTLSGHTAAGPDGDPPPGSYAIDFWYDTDAQGERRITSVRYSGGVVESVECGTLEPDALSSDGH